MEDELQAGDDGFYCVAFRNTKGLTRFELHRHLSQFGRVSRLTADTGLGKRCFVRFSNPEEAVRAMSGLRCNLRVTEPSSVSYVNNSGSTGQLPTGRGAAGPPCEGQSPLFRHNPAAPGNRTRFFSDGNGDCQRRVIQRSEPHRQPHRRQRISTLYVGNLPLSRGKWILRNLLGDLQRHILDMRMFARDRKKFAFVEVENDHIMRLMEKKLNGCLLDGLRIRAVPSYNVGNQKVHSEPPGDQTANGCNYRASFTNGIGGGAGASDRATPGSVSGHRAGQCPAGGHFAPPAEAAGPAGDARDDNCDGGDFHSSELDDMPALILPGPEPPFHREPPFHHEPPFHREPQPARPVIGQRRTFGQRFNGADDDALCDYDAPSRKRSRDALSTLTPPRFGVRRVCSQTPPIEDVLDRHPAAVPASSDAALIKQFDWNHQPSASLTRHQPQPPTPPAGVSERIRSQLHAPAEIVVANFPDGFSEIDILEMFRPYNPLSVRIMVARANVHREEFTYAYVTLANRMGADQAVLDMADCTVQQHHLVVELKKC